LKNLRTATELAETNCKLIAATSHIGSEVDRIATIQKCLLPPPTPTVPGLEVAEWSETYDRAGGDQYDYVPLPNGQWACMISDAGGRFIPFFNTTAQPRMAQRYSRKKFCALPMMRLPPNRLSDRV